MPIAMPAVTPAVTPRAGANRVGASAAPLRRSIRLPLSRLGRPRRRRLKLALQGGGAHGAFTWGVLDALLASEHFEIEAVVGTSAGAMNAVALSHGLRQGGSAAARQTLRAFWERVGRQAKGVFSPTPVDRLMGKGQLEANPGFAWFLAMSHAVSPYTFNPLSVNPLREILANLIDFQGLGDTRRPTLFLAATQVRTGTLKVFSGSEISLEATLASACLPNLFPAVEIEGEAYWDGGFLGNPPLCPLVDAGGTRDVLLIRLDSQSIDRTPRTAQEIRDRINGLMFNNTLTRELALLERARTGLAGALLGRRALRLHGIDAGPWLSAHRASSKYNTDPAFLGSLFQLGQEAAAQWLGEQGLAEQGRGGA